MGGWPGRVVILRMGADGRIARAGNWARSVLQRGMALTGGVGAFGLVFVAAEVGTAVGRYRGPFWPQADSNHEINTKLSTKPTPVVREGGQPKIRVVLNIRRL